MTWENWLLTLSVVLAAIAFTALVIFVIVMLLSMRKMVNDLDQKVHSLDPLFRIVSRAGGVMEKRTERTLYEAERRAEEDLSPRQGGTNTVLEVAEWALVGLALWQKIKERKG